jgi:uncharacterized membrane protein
MSDIALSPQFEAMTRPRQALGAQGLRVLAALLAVGLALPALLFTMLGAWPVLGFLGVELLLVIGLFAMHRRAGARAYERVSLTGGRLTVERADARGVRFAFACDAYWARVRLEEGLQPRVLVAERAREAEIGLFLGAEQRRELAAALAGALAAHRRPVFDNPQLRG